MRRDDHRQAVLDGQPPDHLQHFANQLGIERRGRLVEQQHARLGASARAIATRCCWPPDR
jgi:hypothetical protein